MSEPRSLDRFHSVLVDEIRAHRPDLLTSPFSVAEIYQELVPYRTHRDRLGVDMNGDYEHLLLRLLAGEGEYLVLEADSARRELQSELKATNPNTGRFREFAAADVRLNPERLLDGTPPGTRAAEESPGEAEAEGAAVAVEELAPTGPEHDARAEPGLFDGPGAEGAPVAESPMPTPPPMGQPERLADRAEAARDDGESACRWCRATFPPRENLNYCPFCGTDVHVVPCPSCGEALEPEWRFCIACGAGVATD